jgi:hypothetical protein
MRFITYVLFIQTSEGQQWEENYSLPANTHVWGALQENLHTCCKCRTACIRNYRRHEPQFVKATVSVPFASQDLGVVRCDDDWYAWKTVMFCFLPKYVHKVIRAEGVSLLINCAIDRVSARVTGHYVNVWETNDLRQHSNRATRLSTGEPYFDSR